jgi:hypothetical protein
MKNSIKLLLITAILIPSGFIGALPSTATQRENTNKVWQFPVQECKDSVGSLVDGMRTGVQAGNSHAKALARNLKKKSSAFLLEAKKHKKSVVAAGTVTAVALLIVLDHVVNRNSSETYGRRFSQWFFNARPFGESVGDSSSIFMKDMPYGYFGKPGAQPVVDSTTVPSAVTEASHSQNPLMEELESKLKLRRALLMGTL